MSQHNRVGRPAKFQEPRRAVTITLPQSTLNQLQRLDDDRSLAIVRMVDTAQSKRPNRQPVEIVPVGPRQGLIITIFGSGYSKIPFVRLVEVEPGRNLIALDPGRSIADLELAVADLLAEGEDLTPQDQTLMGSLLKILSQLRKADQISKAEILLVKLGSPKQAERQLAQF